MTDTLNIHDTAVMLGMEPCELISDMVRDGLLLVEPETEDPRCGWPEPYDHVAECGHRFIPVPHPDLLPIG